MAFAITEWPEGLVTRDNREDFVIVPWPPRVLGCLDLDKIHIVNEPAIGANFAAFREEIVNPKLPHFAGDRLGLISPCSTNRPQIVEHGGVDAGMAHGRHDLAPAEKWIRP